MEGSRMRQRPIFRSLRDQDLTKIKFSAATPRQDGIYLKKKVFLGYTDISAAGSRALLSMSLKKEYHDLDISELSSCELMCQSVSDDVEISKFPLQIIHCKYEEFSMIVINAAIPPEKCHLVADKIIQLCMDSEIEKLVILTTLKLSIPDRQLSPLYENAFNTRIITKRPPLPEDTKIHDPLLCMLIQMIQLEHVPCNILSAPGYSAFCSVPSYDDSSLQAIQEFHDFMTGWTKLEFDEAIYQCLEFGRSIKRQNRPGSAMYS